MRRRRTRGNMVLEAALWVPVLVLLVVSAIQFGKITYVYYTLKKIVYSTARYLSVQQGTDFCNPATDQNIQAAINFGITDQTTGTPIIDTLTPDMLSVTTECADPVTGVLGACNASGCGAALGAQRPDYVVVNIPNGYPVTFRIPLLNTIAFSLFPSVTVPYGGTTL